MKIFSPTISGSSQTSGSLTISGSLNVSQGITGSLLGTASWALNSVGGGSGVTQIVAGTNVTISPVGGTGVVTINSSGGGGTTFPYTGSAIISGSLIVTGSTNSSGGFTGSLLGTSSWATNALTSSFINNLNQNLSITGAVILSGSSLPELRVIGDTQFTGSINSLNGYTGSLFGTSSWATNARTASFLPVGTYSITSSWAQSASNAINARTASFLPVGTYSITSSWATNALTASNIAIANDADIRVITANGNGTLNGEVNLTFNGSLLNVAGNLLVTSSAAIGTLSLGPFENTLTLGARDAGSEGGQLGLNAPGGTYTSASFIDNWQNQFRILRGNNTTSDATVANWNLHTKQMQLPAYNSTTAFTATTLVGILGFDANGNILTTNTSSGGGGGGVTILNNTDNYLITATGTANTLNGESNLQFNGSSLTVTGNITASGTITAQANGQMYFRGGDDAELWDINVANTLGVYGQQDQGISSIKLGSGGGIISGRSGSIGIGITTPNSGTLHVSGGVFVTSFTGSLLGTSSWATNALTASFAPNYLLVSQTSSFVQNSQTSSMLAPYVLTSVTSSMLAPYTLNSQTSSFVRNTQTSSMTVLSSSFAATASFAPSYLLVSQTSSFVQNSQTSSFVQNSQTSSMTVLSSSFALTSSLANRNILTASVSLNTITFTKGDGSTFPITVNTGSGGGGGSVGTLQQVTEQGASTTIPITASIISASSITASLQLGGDLNTNTFDIKFKDNDVAYFGNDNDLQIFHDGNDSFIKDNGTGDLRIRFSTIRLEDADGSPTFLQMSNTGFTISSGNDLVNIGQNKIGNGTDEEYMVFDNSTNTIKLYIENQPYLEVGDNNINKGYVKISGSLIITGSTNSSGGFTGSLFGTASHAITASYALSSAGGGGSFSLAGATDVSFSALTDGDLIRYNGIAGKWQNTNLGLSLTPSLSAIEGGYFGGYAKITNWGNYSQPVVQALIKSGSSTIITCSVDTSGQITWSDSSSNYNFTRSLSVQIQDFGDIASEIVTASYVKQTASFRYYRWFAVSASSHVLINDFRFYSGSAQTSTAFPANMTNSGSPAPYVASASGFYVGYPAWQAFDSSTATQWWNLSAPPYQGAFVSIDMGSTFTSSLRSMRMQFGQSFQDFTVANIQGSDDNTTWTTIHTITNVPSANNSSARNFG